LGTSPYCRITDALYQRRVEKSRFFRRIRFLFCQFDHFAQFIHNPGIIFPPVGPQAARAVFYSLLRVGIVAAAVFSQGIQGAEAQNAAEGFRVCLFMAGEVRALLVLKKVVGHGGFPFRELKYVIQ